MASDLYCSLGANMLCTAAMCQQVQQAKLEVHVEVIRSSLAAFNGDICDTMHTLYIPPRTTMKLQSFHKQVVLLVSPPLALFGNRVWLAYLRAALRLPDEDLRRQHKAMMLRRHTKLQTGSA